MGRELIGDITAFDYPSDHVNIIPQICNDVGKYGAGLSGALAARWPAVQAAYFEWHGGQGKGSSGPLELGHIQTVRVERHVMVINMIAQHGVRGRYNHKPIRYQALEMCLIRLFGIFSQLSARFADGHFQFWVPRIGTGLAGGEWSNIKEKVDHWFDRPEFGLTYVVYQ